MDWPHLIAQTISFSIVCALLYWLAYRPVLAMLAARREQIAGGLANAEKIKAELDRIESQRQEVLAQAEAALDAAQTVADDMAMRFAAARDAQGRLAAEADGLSEALAGSEVPSGAWRILADALEVPEGLEGALAAADSLGALALQLRETPDGVVTEGGQYFGPGGLARTIERFIEGMSGGETDYSSYEERGRVEQELMEIRVRDIERSLGVRASE